MSIAVLAALGASFFVSLGIVLSTQISGRPLRCGARQSADCNGHLHCRGMALGVFNELLIQALVRHSRPLATTRSPFGLWQRRHSGAGRLKVTSDAPSALC